MQITPIPISLPYWDIFHLSVSGGTVLHGSQIYQHWWSMSVRQTMLRDQSQTDMRALGKEMFHKSRVLLVWVFLTRCPYRPKGGKIKVNLPPF